MFIPDSDSMLRLGHSLYTQINIGGVIFLNGNLGAGKTTLVRGFLHAAGITSSIRSPTYTLMELYETDKLKVIHMDLYRLSDAEELEYLAVREFINIDTLLFIEWPEKSQGFFKKADLEIKIDYQEEGRNIELLSDNKDFQNLISVL